MGHARLLLRLLPLPLLLAASTLGAQPDVVTVPKSLDGFSAWARKSTACQVGFIAAVEDASFLKGVAALGVRAIPEEPEGAPSGSFTLPHPIPVFGFATSKFTYWADSGSEFYAEVAGTPEAVTKALRARPVAADLKTDYLSGRFTKPPSKAAPYPDMIFVRKTADPQVTHVGCRTFDY
jgi:hypothetical protein